LANSQNGWPCYTQANPPSYKSCWATGRLAPDAAPVLEYLMEQFDKRVERINVGEIKDDDWAFAPRNIEGTSTISNHASGTAVDLNATKHPQFKVGTFTPAQVTEIRKILAELDGVGRWGGDYPAARRDEMHFEINAGPAKVAAVVKKLGLGAALTVTAPAAPVVVTSKDKESIVANLPTLKQGATGLSVKRLQGLLHANGLGAVCGKIDGDYGAKTNTAVRQFQLGAKLTVGPVDQATWAKLLGV